MTSPQYVGLQREEIPSISLDEGKVTINLISGNWDNTKGAFKSLTGVYMSTIYFKPNGKVKLQAPAEHTIFFYVVRGKLTVNGEQAEARQLVEFNNDSEDLRVEAATDSVILFGHALPLNEPVVAQGPFVMNTEQEIHEAYEDYRQGKFGRWS
jgi:redox-sensitive bicupin YhaK (pirin superfamily)